ncbi:CLUMA_CG013770, isoform A [Clunio marinus]|uniref:CLUMA_CG013770, isoform A n=1 Tax=Clunio marinus TaxID=568069 RepID=A0A1J1IJT7_9DIPT|nr:CLUMA_CG013770, isoform A [Clunio marinus]
MDVNLMVMPLHKIRPGLSHCQMPIFGSSLKLHKVIKLVEKTKLFFILEIWKSIWVLKRKNKEAYNVIVSAHSSVAYDFDGKKLNSDPNSEAIPHSDKLKSK